MNHRDILARLPPALARSIDRIRDRIRAPIRHRMAAAAAPLALRHRASALTARLWPRACLLCEQACADDPLCPACAAALPGAGHPRCAICAAPRLGAALATWRCLDCERLAPTFTATIAAADYQPPLAQAITALKFGGQLALASGLGLLLARQLDSDSPGQVARIAAIDCLVPIPLSPARLAERGFNQAEAIARSLHRHWPARHAAPPLLRPALLGRIRNTAPQSSLAGAARHDNVDAGFIADAAVAGQVVGVVDDVMTTGATLDAAARALHAAGASSVIGLVVARTP